MGVTIEVRRQEGSKRWGIYDNSDPETGRVLIEGGFFRREIAERVAETWRNNAVEQAERKVWDPNP